MRRILFSISFIALSIMTVNAQNVRVGLSAGVDAARFSNSGAAGGPLVYLTDLAGGVSVETQLSEKFGLQLDVNYSTQGAGVINADGSTSGSYQLKYITVPLLLRMQGTKNLSFVAGPQVGFLMDAETKSSGDPDTDIKDQLEKTDFYAVFGAEYRFNSGVFFSGRYNVGMTNAIKDKTTDTELKNRYFSFRIGYSFAL